jgi:hypothetical protein
MGSKHKKQKQQVRNITGSFTAATCTHPVSHQRPMPDVRRVVEALGQIVPMELMTVWLHLSSQVEASNPTYLPLPAELALFASYPLFLAARPDGRLAYRLDMFAYDEASKCGVYAPEPLTRDEVCETITDLLFPFEDALLALVQPLAWRVGYLYGWLSALAVVQPHEAGIGMVALTRYVVPLLVSAPGTSTSEVAR